MKNFDEIEITSRLLNIILEMPVEQQLDLLDRLDISGYEGARRYARTYLKNPWIVLIDPEKEKMPYDYFIKDISRCGMFIETSQSFSVSQKITIQFQVPASKKVFKIMGEIVRRQKNGIGIKFNRLSH
ncbi:MAG: PilZ domain-containing protein [Desulfobacula sp.]|uniref:PilZ domain-containing protein n=1 Tax=Desulfobacula sp. TaxID=2593537 RepID=UPI0025C29AC0|nr:PilZ domain-containing protein [Desulfobacula sp.]MCD4721767.1 PilZ domain-containing protein [Desulfobacula sp.]